METRGFAGAEEKAEAIQSRDLQGDVGPTR